MNVQDTDSSTALIVDPNPTSRSILCCQLRDLGVGAIVQAGRVSDARRHLESRSFDIVLCEMEFPHENQSGREMLEDLRRQQMLPLSTVFVMVTGESSYARVAEAAEAALDSYLLKPFSAGSLAERLALSRQRKRALAGIYAAIEREDFSTAAALCLQRFEKRAPYWLYAARIGAELLLRLSRANEARELFEAIAEKQALPWARLGIARAQIEANDRPRAVRVLESLLADQPTFADGYDVLGRVQVEQGQLGEALATYRKAAEITPGSLGRQQKLGILAFYAGDTETATKALERATILGQRSRMFDWQTVVLLSFARFHAKDRKGLQRCATDIAQALETAPQSGRLRRFKAVVDVLGLMQQSQLSAVVDALTRMAGEIRSASFDLEAGFNLLALLALLTAGELTLPDVDEWVDAVGMRFCTSKGISELLGQSASRHPPFSERVRCCHLAINEQVKEGMTHTIEGNPLRAVTSLLERAEQTRNLKFVETAHGVLQRYSDKIDGAGALQAQVAGLRATLAPGAAMPSMGSAGGRPSGGLSMAPQREPPVAA